MKDYIVFERVGYEYTETDIALSELSFEAEKSEFITIIGHNGSGKSTLAKCINALIIPTTGKVVVLGMDTSDDSNALSIRQHAGMVFQNPDNQMVTSIVEDDIAFGPENLGVEPEEIRIRVDKALEVVGMSKYAKHTPNNLSGGQKQRIAIAGVLAMQPDILILDESTAMLDPQGRKEVLDIARNLNELNGITIVLITHEMSEAMIADRIFVMHEGNVVLSGEPKEVFNHIDELEKYSIQLPFEIKLSYELSQAGMDVSISDDIEDIARQIANNIIRESNGDRV